LHSFTPNTTLNEILDLKVRFPLDSAYIAMPSEERASKAQATLPNLKMGKSGAAFFSESAACCWEALSQAVAERFGSEANHLARQ